MSGDRAQRGSVSILIAVGASLMTLFALAAADLGSMLVTRSRAQAAADAAALAAVVQQAPILGQGTDPEGAARETAERNGVSLVSCQCAVGTTEATVTVEIQPRLSFVEGWFGRAVRATARAELDADVMTYEDGGG
jgi:secretion/DNA translocation related TadE-like protein